MTAGYPKSVAAVEERLNHPEKFPNEANVRALNQPKHAKKRESLQLPQLRSLAGSLEKIAEQESDQVVGGEIQEAVLSNGKASYAQSSRLRVPTNLTPTAIINAVSIEGGDYPIFGPPAPKGRAVYINVNCHDGWMFLDGAVLLGGKYGNCHFIFYGKPFYIDPNGVSVSSSVLVVGFATDQAIDAALCVVPGFTYWTTLPEKWQPQSKPIAPVLRAAEHNCLPPPIN